MASATPARKGFPKEIWEEVFNNLELRDVKAARLVCSIWNPIASRFLFRTFVFRKDRRDFERFNRVIGEEDMAAGVRTLQFQIGTMNIFFVGRNLADIYINRRTDDVVIQYDTEPLNPDPGLLIGRLEIAERLKDQAIEEYADWNVRWRKSNQDYNNLEAIANVLKRLRRLDRIDVTVRSTPFESPLLCDAWIQDSGNGSFPRKNQEFTNIIKALSMTEQRLKHLRHDHLPVTFLQEPAEVLSIVAPLQHLQSLHFTFHATHAPPPKFWRNLGLLLGKIPLVKSLRFGFDPIETELCDEEFWILAIDPQSWYVPLWHIFQNCQWRHLRKLRLDGMMFCEHGLKYLLLKLVTTLRDLKLHNIGLWQGSFISMFANIRSNFSLTNFRVSGTLCAFHAYNEAYTFPKIDDPSEDMWCPSFAGTMQQYVSVPCWGLLEIGTRNRILYFTTVARLIENYVLGGELPSLIAILGFDTRLFTPALPLHDETCQNCWNELIDRDEAWAANNALSDEDWETHRNDDMDENGEDVVELYDDLNEFDENGYDIHGYSENGSHYLDEAEGEPGMENSGDVALVNRDIVASILHRIPRYWGGGGEGDNSP